MVEWYWKRKSLRYTKILSSVSFWPSKIPPQFSEMCICGCWLCTVDVGLCVRACAGARVRASRCVTTKQPISYCDHDKYDDDDNDGSADKMVSSKYLSTNTWWVLVLFWPLSVDSVLGKRKFFILQKRLNWSSIHETPFNWLFLYGRYCTGISAACCAFKYEAMLRFGGASWSSALE